MAMNLKDFFDIDKVTFSIEELEAPYEELEAEVVTKEKSSEKLGSSSMYFNGTRVSLENIEILFEGYSLDICFFKR